MANNFQHVIQQQQQQQQQQKKRQSSTCFLFVSVRVCKDCMTMTHI